MNYKNNLKDEILELVWTKKEEGSVTKDDLLKSEEPKITAHILEEMIKDDFLFEITNEINLTEKGRDIAFHLIRAHRIAERLFADVLEISDEFMEANACTFEHILSLEVTQAICTLLGHPRACPHGRPVPQGECCKKTVKEVERIVLPLAELKAGESGKVAYAVTKHSTRLDQLTTLGLSPGQKVRVNQTVPSFVIKVSETDIALDKDILKDIYVRRI